MKKRTFFKRIYNSICSYIISNRLFFSYVVFSLLACMLAREFTVGYGYDIRSFVVELSIILMLGSFCYLKKTSKRFSYLFKLVCFYSALGIIHSLYFPVNEKFKDYICNPKTNLYRNGG